MTKLKLYSELFENFATLGNTVGMGAVNIAPSGTHTGQPDVSNDFVGSGDRYDNGSFEDDEDGKKKKRKKHLDSYSKIHKKNKSK